MQKHLCLLVFSIFFTACGNPTKPQGGAANCDECNDSGSGHPTFWGVEGKDFCNVEDPNSETFVAVSWNIGKRALDTRRDSGRYQDFLNVMMDLNADIYFLQEVTARHTEIRKNDIRDTLKRARSGSDYNVLISKRVGPTSSPGNQETYVVIYDKNVLTVRPDGGINDIETNLDTESFAAGQDMIRQPFSVYVKVKQSQSGSPHEFRGWFIQSHTRPESPQAENDKLAANYSAISTRIKGGSGSHGGPSDLDIILVGDLNTSPSSSRMQNNYKNLFPTLRRNTKPSRTSAINGSLIQSGGLADNFMIPEATIEDFHSSGVFPFDSIPQYVTTPGERSISDHRPIWARFCKYRDTDPL